MSIKQEHRYQKMVISNGRIETDLQREIEAAFMERGQRPAPVPPQPKASRRQVRSWMRLNVVHYEGETQLAEGANIVFDIPNGGLDNETHWVWDEAFDAFEWYENL
jgi:uncharacterized protein (DUF2342 family)